MLTGEQNRKRERGDQLCAWNTKAGDKRKNVKGSEKENEWMGNYMDI